jgi:hypothetical protein
LQQKQGELEASRKAPLDQAWQRKEESTWKEQKKTHWKKYRNCIFYTASIQVNKHCSDVMIQKQKILWYCSHTQYVVKRSSFVREKSKCSTTCINVWTQWDLHFLLVSFVRPFPRISRSCS